MIKWKRNLFVIMILSLITVMATACSSSDTSEKATDTYADYVPDTETIYGYIEDLAAIGERQSGTEGGIEAQEYLMDKFEEYGLEDIHVIQTETDVWECDDWKLEIEGQEIDSYRMYMTLFDGKYEVNGDGELKKDEDGNTYKGGGTYGTFSTSDEGNVEDAEIIYVESAEDIEAMDDADIEGKVVVSNIKSLYDEPTEYYAAQEKGAVAFVGILSEYFDSNKYNPEDVTYVNGSFLIPGYYVTANEGDDIISTIEKAEKSDGAAEAHFEMTVTVERTDAAGSVVGILPGSEDGDGKMIMVSSHYDSMTPEGATQDASGCSEVLALANFFSQIPQEDRARGILFVLNDTHDSDYDAHDNVVAEYLAGEWNDEACQVVPNSEESDVLADICVEHISEEAVITDDNELEFTGNVSYRYAAVTGTDELVDIVSSAIENLKDEEETGLTEITELEVGDELVSDADFFWCYGYGIPVVSFISAQPYMYDDCDTLDKVPQRALVPVAESLANITWDFMNLDEAAFTIEE